MCFRPAAVEMPDTDCPECGQKIHMLPGVEMKECPNCIVIWHNMPTEWLLLSQVHQVPLACLAPPVPQNPQVLPVPQRPPALQKPPVPQRHQARNADSQS